jgi:flagellar motor switch protein FliG
MATKTLSGPEKAAVLVTVLEPSTAAKLLTDLPDEDLIRLVAAAASIEERGLDSVDRKAIAQEFVDALEKGGVGQGVDRPIEALKSALEGASGPDRWSRAASQVGVTGPRAMLRTLTPDRLAAALENEPNSVATILFREMDSNRAADVVKRLPPERQTEIVSSLVTPDTAPARVVERVLSAVTSKASRQAGKGDDQRRLRTIAEILTMLPPGSDKLILDRIREVDDEAAGKIRELMFTIDDLPLLDKKAIQKAISTLDMKTLALILKGAPPPIRNLILENVSEKRRAQILEEKESLGAVALSEVTEAQKQLVGSAWKLIESGEASLRRGSDAVIE